MNRTSDPFHQNVVLGYAHPGMVHQPFMTSVLSFQRADGHHRGVLANVYGEQQAYIPAARNGIVRSFLDRGPHEWLMFLDYDIRFHWSDVYRLLDVADPNERPIVGGLYFTQLSEREGGRTRDLELPVFLVPHNGIKSRVLTEFQLGQVYELDATGMGFTVIHRSVLEALRDAHEPPWQWFGHDQVPGDMLGEDVTFCRRAKKLGFSTWGYTGVDLGHIKRHELTLQRFIDHPEVDARDA